VVVTVAVVFGVVAMAGVVIVEVGEVDASVDATEGSLSESSEAEVLVVGAEYASWLGEGGSCDLFHVCVWVFVCVCVCVCESMFARLYLSICLC